MVQSGEVFGWVYYGSKGSTLHITVQDMAPFMFLLVLKWQNSQFGFRLFTYTDVFFLVFLNKCRDLWRTSVCFMKETDVRNLRWGERWIQKALEHHQTGKVSHPQMIRGERKKSSQIFPSLPKWQLVCKLLPPPPTLPSPSSISPPKST